MDPTAQARPTLTQLKPPPLPLPPQPFPPTLPVAIHITRPQGRAHVGSGATRQGLPGAVSALGLWCGPGPQDGGQAPLWSPPR